MKVIEKILYYTFVIGWILAPIIVRDVLYSRNIILPDDLGTYGIVIWYAIGMIQTAWNTRKQPKKSQLFD